LNGKKVVQIKADIKSYSDLPSCLKYKKILILCSNFYAGVAQLVEQLICNQPVGGSNPFTSSLFTSKSHKVGWSKFKTFVF
jgi:hypothetical protein